MINGQVSFWMRDTAGSARDPAGAARPERPPLDGDTTVDVCVVGAGYTGLWTAYWLRQALPDASILVVEARHVGYGASGRNGGWLSGKMIGLPRHLAEGPRGRQGVVELRRAAVDSFDEILGIMADHDIDVDAVHGGYLTIGRTPSELARLRAAVDAERAWGMTEEDVRLLSAAETAGRISIDGVLGALYSPHNVRLHPGKLVTGLASVVEAAGIRIAERTPALDLRPGRVRTPHGTVTARHILRATEGYTARLPGRRRDMLPMNSSMVVTEPLSEADWKAIGWAGCEALSGAQHTYFYAQRTADGRIALGGRGLPYRFGSRLDRDGRLDRWTIGQLSGVLHGLWPDLRFRLAHAWCGSLGVPRDWSPSVVWDPATGLGHAGGYVGQGVTAAYLAGRTLADLVAGKDTRYTGLPWAGRRSPRWEPEPLRWLGSYAMYGLYRIADLSEATTRHERTSAFARLADTVSGRH
ncbi:NAD(P)/FAD-dependent oxidoreductase [Streptomyces sparsogenes]|uniref:NAD(P)/FAD-dependent oxidoreductase n=1 Tax=Streptomyces sparsogenes TaxID=67365 RepID=UPI0038511461